MKAKKYKHADLENKRSIFFQIGLVCALALAFTAFEWTSDEGSSNVFPVDDEVIVDDILPPITMPEKPKPKLPVPPRLNDVIIITDAEVDIEVDIEFPEYEDTKDGYYVEPVIEEPDEEELPFIRVEQMPEFPGGEREMLKYIAAHIKYPAICAEMGIQGRVYVSFVIDKKGNVTDVKVVRSPHESLAEEAIRVVEAMPQWKPGKQRNKAVRVAYNIPVNFVLQ